MPKSSDFQKIYNRFVKQYGPEKGKNLYFAFIKKKGYDDTKPFPKSQERKEFQCPVIGLEVKELEGCFHVEGLIATTHVDNLAMEEGVDIPDKITKETLESFADQMNSNRASRVMGVHHSEGAPLNQKYLNWIEDVGAESLRDSSQYGTEYFGEADVVDNPVKVIELTDGEHGLFVDTKLLKTDPMTPKIMEGFGNGHFDSFSITYDTDGFMTTDFGWVGDDLVRILLPKTRLAGYTAASHAKNPNAVATAYGFKEFKELVGMEELNKKMEVKKMPIKKEIKEDEDPQGTQDEPSSSEGKDQPDKDVDKKPGEGGDDQPSDKPEGNEGKDSPGGEGSEQKEFQKWKAGKKELEEKELLDKTAGKIAEGVLSKMEMKEKVLKDNKPSGKDAEVSLEIKEFREAIENPEKLELKEQFRRAAAVCDHFKLDWQSASTSACESREYKSFGVKGRNLEFKGLGITTNLNDDGNYLQSSAELQDVYDPVIYNALNQQTLTWNLLAKDDLSKKGNNQVQFTLKIAANTSAAFYTGNAVTTGNVGRLKYQTKFKKLQVGVSVDGDMIAAARGGPVSDVFAQEVMDSTIDMLAVLNLALFAEVGLETAKAIIGFEYITDNSGNGTLYNLSRSSTNKLAPDSNGDTFIDQDSEVISMSNLRAAIRQAVLENALKRNLVFITSPTQGDMLRGKYDDSRRLLKATDTDFGFSTDLFVDGIPVFEDKDCNTDDWWLVDLETHRVAIWIPPTIEKLGKAADSEDAFIKTYFATYNRAPRRMVQIYGCATS